LHDVALNQSVGPPGTLEMMQTVAINLAQDETICVAGMPSETNKFGGVDRTYALHWG